MIVIEYTNPKKYKETQWFVTDRYIDRYGDVNYKSGFRYMLDNRFAYGYFMMTYSDIPEDIEEKGKITTDIPFGLIWHIFDLLFSNDEDEKNWQSSLIRLIQG